MSLLNFIPQAWAGALLRHLDKKLVFTNLFNRDYEGEISDFGQIVKINQIGDVTIRPYIPGEAIEGPENISGAQQTLTIDQSNYFNIQINDIDKAQVQGDLLAKAGERAGYGMADVIDRDLAAVLAAAVPSEHTIGTSGAPKTDLGTSGRAYEYLLQAGTILDEANVPSEGRKCVPPAWFVEQLMRDDRWTGYGTADNVTTRDERRVGRAAGFEIWQSNNCPRSGNVYEILFATQEAGTYAEQVVHSEAYRPEAGFSDAWKGYHVYGRRIVQPKCTAKLYAQRPSS